MATALSLQSAPTQGSIEGITMSASDLAGNTFVNDGRTALLLQNSDAAQQTCTITQIACSHGRTETETITLEAGELGLKAIFPRAEYGSTVTVTTSDVDVKLAAIQYTTS